MPENWDGLVWLLVLMGPLLFLQRSLHREVQAVFLLLTRRVDIALVMFSIMFFPGVLLHESSHYVMARLLGVRTGRFSLLPRPMPDGKLQLGYVETSATDWVRDALVGIAPLLTGGVFVAYAGLIRLGLTNLWTATLQGGIQGLADVLPQCLNQPDFWLWFYLVVTVSSTMLPSPSDRRAWLPLAILLGLLLGGSLLAGAGPWLLENVAPLLNRLLLAIAAVEAIAIFVHVVLLLPTWLIRKVLAGLTGLEVVSN